MFNITLTRISNRQVIDRILNNLIHVFKNVFSNGEMITFIAALLKILLSQTIDGEVVQLVTMAVSITVRTNTVQVRVLLSF